MPPLSCISTLPFEIYHAIHVQQYSGMYAGAANDRRQPEELRSQRSSSRLEREGLAPAAPAAAHLCAAASHPSFLWKGNSWHN